MHFIQPGYSTDLYRINKGTNKIVDHQDFSKILNNKKLFNLSFNFDKFVKENQFLKNNLGLNFARLMINSLK